MLKMPGYILNTLTCSRKHQIVEDSNYMCNVIYNVLTLYDIKASFYKNNNNNKKKTIDFINTTFKINYAERNAFLKGSFRKYILRICYTSICPRNDFSASKLNCTFLLSRNISKN